MESESVHPSEQELSAYGLGKLDDARAEAVGTHLENCPDCRRRAAEASPDSFLGRLRHARGAPEGSIAGESLADGTLSFLGAQAPAAPPSAETLPPELVEHPDYQIKRELGRGGMGVVYLAHNALMGRDEVLKVMGRHIIDRPGVLDRFQREIRAVANLRHPNIVAAYTAFRIDGGLVFAMEYIEGLDLSRVVKSRGPLPVVHAAYFIHQAALGLQHAHEKGMIHRDIKPHNLMLTHDSKARLVKVLDFGLAKASREQKVDSALTREGQALGTPDYIAPEQILNAPEVDIRADIYSLGGTLYYLLTGRPPFQAKSLYDVYQAHISREADPLNLLRPEVPSELAALVAKMMAKDPARRFQTPGEVSRALTPFFKNKKGSARVVPELSVTGRPEPRTEAVTPISNPISTSTSTQVTAPAPPTQEDLIESARTKPPEPPLSRGTVPAAGRRKPPWVWPSAAAGVLLLGLVASLAAGVFRVKTREGTIVIDGLPPQAEVLVDGETVTVHFKDGRGPAEVTAPPGRHGVQIKKDGFETFGTEVSLNAGETTSVRARLEPLTVAAPSATDRSKPVETVASSPSDPEDAAPRKATGQGLAEVPSTEPRVITNSLGMKLALIPAGEFIMGAPDSDLDRPAKNKPQHRVRITRPFHLGVTEVTQGQYRAVTGRNPSEHQGSDDLPVESVSWFEAVTFCNSLSEKEGLKLALTTEGKIVPGGSGYRLPTEAEWEYACRAGTTTRFHFADNPDSLREYGWYKFNSGNETHPVGQLRPNAWGCFDMHGNVWEWCLDGFQADFYGRSPEADPVADPVGQRVTRGECAFATPQERVTQPRYPRGPGHRGYRLGFRVALIGGDARTLPPSAGRRTSPAEGSSASSLKGKDPGGRPSAEVPSMPGATVLSGSWRVERGELLQASEDGGQMSTVLFGDPEWTDYDFTFEMKSDPGTGAANVFYRAGPQGKKALVFVVPSKPNPCRVEVWPEEDGEGGGGGEPEGPARFRFVKGTWIPVRVRVRGNRSVCSVFEHGREVVAIRLGTGKHAKGRVGLSTFGSSYRFRNIQVTAPDGKSLWKGVPDLPN